MEKRKRGQYTNELLWEQQTPSREEDQAHYTVHHRLATSPKKMSIEMLCEHCVETTN